MSQFLDPKDLYSAITTIEKAFEEAQQTATWPDIRDVVIGEIEDNLRILELNHCREDYRGYIKWSKRHYRNEWKEMVKAWIRVQKETEYYHHEILKAVINEKTTRRR